MIRNSLIQLFIAIVGGNLANAEWPQWGGPKRDFTVSSVGLADSWPASGPKTVWHRELGDGYSSIVYSDGVLYTMYRKERTGKREYAIALDATNGNTLWEHSNKSPLLSRDDSGWGGQGPNSTPLIVGGRLYTIGSSGVLHCFDKSNGEVTWEHDLLEEFDVSPNNHVGYSPSPIAYERTLIIPLGGPRSRKRAESYGTNDKGQTLVALNQATGEILWSSLEYNVGESSPILIRFAEKDQLVLTCRRRMVGVDPKSGALLWEHPVGGSIVTPVWNGVDSIFYSSGGDNAVGRVVRLKESGDGIAVEELWSNRKINVWQPTPVYADGCFYGSTKELLICADMTTGERHWVKRGFPMASCIRADNKLIILDENGTLTLGSASRDGFTVYSQSKVTERYSFTVPTLVEKRLYVRDRRHIMAFDIG
ncbi:MAG: PQQ-like beta-propeller repeat protein [Phycisphaerales bacterium]|nr:MAG: PQQ-like beta-propeller repeat protein [Phycisphaerales bacterium]